jgi:DNA-binding transcriptional ArsR family regulator
MLDLLAEHGELSVGKLAAEFPDLVASGISKHLMELREVGPVHATRQGRQQPYPSTWPRNVLPILASSRTGAGDRPHPSLTFAAHYSIVIHYRSVMH